MMSAYYEESLRQYNKMNWDEAENVSLSVQVKQYEYEYEYA